MALALGLVEGASLWKICCFLTFYYYYLYGPLSLTYGWWILPPSVGIYFNYGCWYPWCPLLLFQIRARWASQTAETEKWFNMDYVSTFSDDSWSSFITYSTSKSPVVFFCTKKLSALTFFRPAEFYINRDGTRGVSQRP